MFNNPEKWLAKSCGTKLQLGLTIFMHLLLYCMGVLGIFLYVAKKEISFEGCIVHTVSLFFIGVVMPAWYLYAYNKILAKKKLSKG